MSISCVICGLWYPEDARDRLDICPECRRMNFAGSQELLGHEPEQLEMQRALDAYVSVQPPPSPLQVEAMRRVHQRWEAEALRRMQARWALEGTGGEDLA
jgi:hypothetical protein